MSEHEHAADGARNASTDAASQGPPAELPDAVPDFVGEIHSAINGFLGGGIETIGDVVSGIAASTGGGEAAAAAMDVAAVLPA